MGFLQRSEFDSFSRVPLPMRGEILCRYLKDGESLTDIGQELFGTEGTQASRRPSQVSRAFGFSGKGQAGRYRNVPEKAFYDFVRDMPPEHTGSGWEEGTFDRWLKAWYQRQRVNPAADERNDYEDDEPVNTTPIRPVHTPRPPVNIPSGDDSYRPQRSYVNPSVPNLGRFSPIVLLLVVCVVLWGAGKVMDFGRFAIFSGKQMVGNVNNFLSAQYNAEIFEYEGKEFAGNRRFNKPAGACMRMDGGKDYTIGYFDGAELDGYGIIVQEDGDNLQLGAFEKNQLNGYAILRCNGVDYVAKFKKGEADGYGYCYDHGKEQIVKFKDVSAALVNFAATEIIAERSGDQWLKPNGKALKMKDNTYKGIEWLREGLIAIDGVEYYFDAEVQEAYYDSPETRLSWDTDGCEYDSILTDDEGTWLYYIAGDKLEGKHQYKEKKDLLINTFSVNISYD